MLAITVRLRFGAYDAGDEADPRQAEWPPHPARVFCALVASDPTDEEWTALRWLEDQPPPEVLAPRLIDRHSHEAFVPTNVIKPANPNLPGRINDLRRKPRALPRRDRFVLVWPEADPSGPINDHLVSLARRVPYIGRATASAEVSVSSTLAADDLDRYVAAGADATVDLRVPYPGYSAALADLHERGARSWEASRLHGYRLVLDTPAEEEPVVRSGPFDRLMVFRLPRGSHLHAARTVPVAQQLRKAVMDLMPDPPPPALSGHNADGRPHVAFLGLPNVGHTGHLPGGPPLSGQPHLHADGRLLAVGLAVPRGESALAVDLYRALVTGQPKHPLRQLNLKGGNSVELIYDPAGSGPSRARATTWTQPSHLWATATPVVFDRYPKGRSRAAMVSEALVQAGYPAPTRVVADRTPILAGAPTPSRSNVQRRAGMPVKPWAHAWVEFAAPQEGPVLAGSMRYLGFGLFLPLGQASVEQATRRDGEAP